MFGSKQPKFMQRAFTASDIEQENWRRRMADMPTIGDTFDMVREIVHSVAAMVGTTLARVESINVSTQALIQQNSETRGQLADLNARCGHIESILTEGKLYE